MLVQTKTGLARVDNNVERKGLFDFASYRFPVERNGIGTSSYDSLYRAQVWIHVCVNKIAREVAGLPIKTYALDDNGDRARVYNHPVAQLLQNPYEGGSSFSFWEAVTAHVAVHGEALVWLDRPRAGAAPTAMVPLDPASVSKRFDGSTLLAYEWRRSRNAEPELLTPDDVIAFRYWQGVSPLEPLRRTLQMEEMGQQYAIASFENAARPSGLITFDRGLNEEQRQSLQNQINSRHGGVSNAFRVAVLDQAANWTPFSHNAQEAEVIAHRKLNREEVAAVFNIPAPMIGILDNATYSNITTQKQMFYGGTLAPWLSMLEKTLMAKLINKERSFSGVFVEFDLSGVLRGDAKERSETYARFINSGVYSVNEIRKFENLPRINDPKADAINLPLNLEPVHPDLPEDTPEVVPEEND